MSIGSATMSTQRLGSPLGAGRGWLRRLFFHHLPLALASAAVIVLFVNLPWFGAGMRGDIMSSPLPSSFGFAGMSMNHAGDSGGGMRLTSQVTMATGYVATMLLGLTLLIGPMNLLLRRRHPISSPLARDIGTWATIVGVVHVIFGFQVHGGNASDISTFYAYFFADGWPLANSFGLGNWVGLAALVIVVLLITISNDRALRELKAKRWKSLQRLNYTLFGLVILHAFFYGALLQPTSPYTLVLIGTVAAILMGQSAGIRMWRRRYAS
jgi:sulfoxide reductase heme-binding subunit YedZ